MSRRQILTPSNVITAQVDYTYNNRSVQSIADKFGVSSSTIARALGLKSDSTYETRNFRSNEEFPGYMIATDGRVWSRATQSFIKPRVTTRGVNKGLASVRIYDRNGVRRTVAIGTLLG